MDPCSEDEFQPIPNSKRLKPDRDDEEDDVNLLPPKSNKPFSPKVNLVKSKNKKDLYRDAKKTMQKRVYSICKNNDISAAIALPTKLFSKDIEVAGKGFALDEFTVTHVSNFVPDVSAKEEMTFQEYRRKIYPEQVPNDLDIDVDSFLKSAVLKTLGVAVTPGKRSVPENPVGDDDSGEEDSGDEESGEENSGDEESGDDDDGDRTTPEKSQIIGAHIIQKWLDILPTKVDLLYWNADYVKDPLYRFMDNEGYQAKKLLQKVREDLESFLIWIQEGDDSDDGVESLKKGRIPLEWVQYEVPAGLTVDDWISDFIARINHIQETIEVVGEGGPSILRSLAIWVGGLLNPENFMEATRECVSKLNYTPMEDLELHLTVGEKLPNQLGFDIKDLKLKGASFRNDQLFVTKATTDVSSVTLYWLKKKEDKSNLSIPFYASSSKETKLYDVLVPMSSTQNIKNISKSGVEFVATSTFDKM